MLAGTFVTVPVLLVLLAGQVNTDPRYVSPAIPAVGLALVALLRLLDIRLVTALVVLVLGAQFANVTLQNLYSGTPSALVDEDYRQLPQGRSATASELQRIVEATCTEETASKYNGASLTTVAGLNPFSRAAE